MDGNGNGSSKLSEFRAKLQILITELTENQPISSHQLHNPIHIQIQEQEEASTKIMQLQADLTSSIQLRQQLQRNLHFLQDDNHLLRTNNNHLNQTITTILQAKQAFLNAYQESTCQIKTSIQSRDTKIAMLSDKINAHLLSLDSIRNEASSVKQLVDDAQHVLHQKQQLVARLKIQMDKVCEFETLLIEKNNDLEAKLKSNEKEFHRKDKVIAELQTQLEMAKLTHRCPSKVQELQEAVLTKENIIETLLSENKALRSELGMLEVSFKIFQDTMSSMDEEDRIAYSLILANQEKDREDGRINRDTENFEANTHHEASRTTVAEIAESPCKERAYIVIPSRENNNVHSCVSESTFSPSSSVHSESQLAANASNVPAAEDKDICNTCKQQLDSECSTTQARMS